MAFVCLASLLALVGAKGDAETIGDVAAVVGLSPIKVEGIGLVVGLQGHGGEPPPGAFRENALAQLKLHDIPNPNALLESGDVSVVLIRGYVHPGCRKGDRFDLEISVVPGDQSTKNLNGGNLLKTELREVFGTGKGVVNGAVWATGEGRALTLDVGGEGRGALFGKVLGGGSALKDRDLALRIDEGRHSVRLSKEIAAHINSRFPVRFDRKVGPAESKTDRQIELKPISAYRHNLARYLATVARIPLNLDERGRSELKQRLKGELLDPTTSYNAAAKLEALGPSAAPALAEGLGSPAQLVRFGAAEALAYLGDPRGVKELGLCAEGEPLYRAYAIAALAANPMPISGLKLVQLMQSTSVETRYGSFRALMLLDEKNPAIMGEKLAEEFWLHEIPSKREPLAHAARRHRPEIVIFGDQQKFLPPLLVRLGDRFVVQTVGNGDQVMIAKFAVGKEPERLEAPNNVGDAIRGLAKLGAGYTEAVEFLKLCFEQQALEGRFEINALPKPAQLAEIAASGRDGQLAARQMPVGLPSMFQEGPDDGAARAVRLRAEGAAEAEAPAKPKPGFWRKLQFWRAN